jgi:hypothetical protein
MNEPIVLPIPGHRIDDYRNSMPRLVRLFGLGPTGSKIARDVLRQGRPNVTGGTGVGPVGWTEVAGERPDRDTNMIVIVCAEGDQVLFQADDNKPASLVTFVLLQDVGNMLVVRDKDMTLARDFSDLFVTTSDVDYVGDLIDNLAS